MKKLFTLIIQRKAMQGHTHYLGQCVHVNYALLL
jgi:hypothetical protein